MFYCKQRGLDAEEAVSLWQLAGKLIVATESFLDFENNELEMVALDGFRMAVSKNEVLKCFSMLLL